MEEIKTLHELNIEWGCITNLMDKISDIEDKIEGGWPELIDMVADAVDEDSKANPTDLFFDLYQFLFRLYYRLKTNPEVREFNQVTRVNKATKEVYRVTNYNYQNFKWAKNNGFADKISNDFIDIDPDKLDDKTKRAFERRCK
jgi:hypothetical protein